MKYVIDFVIEELTNPFNDTR